MKISRIASIAVLSAVTAGVALAQERPAGKPFKGLRNTTPRPARVRPVSAPEFGGVNIQYQRISAAQFTSDVSVNTLTSTWLPGFVNDFQRYFYTSGWNHLVSSPTLPGGSRIVYVELDACDASTVDEHVNLTVWNCNYEGECDGTPLTDLTTVSDVVDPCWYYTDEAISQRVDNYLGQTLLDVTIDAIDGSNTFSGVIIGYVLEVSPAPLMATFNDVPTNHPFFQFIEALVEAGVTAGCGNGNYCPDNPVTRGQMAVFMSKLTGLSWNGF